MFDKYVISYGNIFSPTSLRFLVTGQQLPNWQADETLSAKFIRSLFLLFQQIVQDKIITNLMYDLVKHKLHFSGTLMDITVSLLRE